MGYYSEPGSELCFMLRKLDKNNKLHIEEKKWMRDKGMFKFVKFIDDWEKNSKPNFKLLNRYRKCSIMKFAEQYNISIQNKKSKLFYIFKEMTQGKRILPENFVWLVQKGFMNQNLRIEFHKREAIYYEENYRKKKDLWSLVNACSHLRKSKDSMKSIKLINNLNFSKIKSKQLKSALLITQGGAYRDLGYLDDTLRNAEKGFNLTPKSFYPCTLQGAIYYQKGQFGLGDKWFAKAIENGATQESLDSELNSIYRQSKGKEKENLKKHFQSLGLDIH